MESFNRRYVLIAVVGAAGLALGVDKFVLSDGLTSPSAAAAGQVAPESGAATVAKAKVSNEAKILSPAAKLEVYRKSSEANTPATPVSRDAMKHQGWISKGTAKDGAAGKVVVAKYKHVFELTGVAGGSVRLRRNGDPDAMKRGQLLRVGQTVNWSPESGAVVTLVSIAPDNQSVVIQVDGENREVRLFSDSRSDSVVRTSTNAGASSENP